MSTLLLKKLESIGSVSHGSMGLPNKRTQFVDLAFFALDRIQQGRHIGVVNSQGINYSILCGFTLSHKIQLPRIHTHMSRENKKEKKKGLPILVIFSCALLCHYIANAEIFQIYLICVNVLNDLQCQINSTNKCLMLN
jgi:hypothetical protein